MAVLQRIRLLSNERLDLPDALNVDAFANADWAAFVGQFFTGSGSPLVISGFDIPSPDTYVTKKAASVLVTIANSMMFHPESVGGAGGFFVAGSSEPQQSIALTPNQTNFIELDQSTSISGSDTRAIWDEAGGTDGSGEEFKETIDTVTNLTVIASVNTVGFTAAKAPLAKVVVDVNGVVTSITDCRNLMFRLGTGGTSPDATFRYGWPDGRTDHAVTLTTADPTLNPFEGADKAITNFKTWANAVMSRLAELQGPGAKWFEGGSTGSGSLSDIFMDAAGSIVTSKSGAGEFQWNGGGNTLTWSSDIEVRSICGPYFFTIKATSATLNTGDVAYLSQLRNLPFPGASDTLAWTNSATYVNGNVLGGSFTGMESDTTSAAGRGDWIMKDVDGIHRYVRIKDFYNAPGGLAGGGGVTTAALAVSVELVSAYTGSTGNAQGVYSKGAYTITAGPAANVTFSTNTWWLASRWGTPTGQLYTRDGKMMTDGEHRVIGASISTQLLTYIGSPNAGASAPSYATNATGAVAAPNWSAEVTAAEGLTIRASKLTTLAADASQDKNLSLICKVDPAFSWVSGTSTLTWADLYLSITGDDEQRNKIAGASAVLADYDCLYVTMNRSSGANTTLGVTKVDIRTLDPTTLGDQVYIFARRIGAVIYTRHIPNNTTDITVHDVKPSNQVLFSGGHYLDDNRADLYYRALQVARTGVTAVSTSNTTALVGVTVATLSVVIPTGYTGDVFLTGNISWWAAAIGKTCRVLIRQDGVDVSAASYDTDDLGGSVSHPYNVSITTAALGLIAGTYSFTLNFASFDNATRVDSTSGNFTFMTALRIP